jgi:hypothetical protein
MKGLLVILLMVAAGCGSKPCVDGERTSAGYFGYGGATRTSYDPCKQRCGEPEWTRGCACSKRCPCWERHSRP